MTTTRSDLPTVPAMVLHPVCHPGSGTRVVYHPGDSPNLLVECTTCGGKIVAVGVLGPKGEQLPGNVYTMGVQFHGAPYERGADGVFHGKENGPQR